MLSFRFFDIFCRNRPIFGTLLSFTFFSGTTGFVPNSFEYSSGYKSSDECFDQRVGKWSKPKNFALISYFPPG